MQKILIPKPQESYSDYINRILSNRDNIKEKGSFMERHHILPRCCGGTDSPENLIWLYLQEHYYAHELLYKENPDNIHLARAWWFLSRHEGLDVTSEQYEALRSKYIQSISGPGNPNYGHSRLTPSNSKTVIRVMDGKEWESMKQCCLDENISKERLRKLCQNKELYMYEEDYVNFINKLETYLHTPFGHCFD